MVPFAKLWFCGRIAILKLIPKRESVHYCGAAINAGGATLSFGAPGSIKLSDHCQCVVSIASSKWISQQMAQVQQKSAVNLVPPSSLFSPSFARVLYHPSLFSPSLLSSNFYKVLGAGSFGKGSTGGTECTSDLVEIQKMIDLFKTRGYKEIDTARSYVCLLLSLSIFSPSSPLLPPTLKKK